MLWIFLVLLPLFMLLLWFFFFPIRYTRAKASSVKLLPPNLYVYSYVFHVHTQFSYDSLGKPEDVLRAREENGIDFVVTTDHDVDHMKYFADDRLVVGVERKINDERGKLLGDLIEVGGLKVIVHHFKDKYRWRLEKSEEYLFELIDLKDALLKNKIALFFYLLAALFVYPFSRKKVIENLTKLIDVGFYSQRYLEEGWKSRIIGGVDHHVKIYVREVGTRFLFPAYNHSFKLLRNFLLSEKSIENKGELLEAIKRCTSVISFCEKPSLLWVEGKRINVYLPYRNCLVVLRSAKEKRECIGSNHVFFTEGGNFIIESYTYTMKLGRLLFNVKPISVGFLRVE